MEIIYYVFLLLMAAFYIYAGVSHFTNEKFFLRIAPPFLPYPRLMVQLSGVAEILLGIGVCIPMFRTISAWGIIALLIVVYPVNIYMLWARIKGLRFKNISVQFLWIRVFLQLGLIYLAYFYSL